MAYLLDTCVVSEFFKITPNENVKKWFDEQLPEALYLSVLTIGEVRKGVSKLPQSKKRDQIASWLEAMKNRYHGRVLSFELETAEIWGRIRAQAKMEGRSLSMIDSQIAASALEQSFIVVTRNIADFEQSGVKTLNPWEEKAK